MKRILFLILFLCMALPAWAQSLAINAIGGLPPAQNNTISGTAAGYGSAPTLQYSINGGGFVSATGGTITTTAWSFVLPPQITVATATLTVRDAVTTSITTSAQYAVAGASETPSNFYTTVANVVITDSCGDAFALTPGGAIYQNGIIDPVTHNVVQLAYFNHQIYQLGTGLWYVKTCATGTYVQFGSGTTSPITTNETISINNIGNQTTLQPFTVTGSVAGAVVLPTLQYQVNAGPLSPISYSTINGPFSFLAAGLPTAAVDTLTILDALTGVSQPSNGFCVGGSGPGGRPILLLFGFNHTYPYVRSLPL